MTICIFDFPYCHINPNCLLQVTVYNKFAKKVNKKFLEVSQRMPEGQFFTFCICTGRSRGDVYPQQGDGTGRDLITFTFHLISNNQVKYIGHADFAAGIWIGLELRNPKGKHLMVITTQFKDIPEH